MLRSLLLRVARNDGLRRLVTAAPPTKAVVDRFIAGQSVADGLAAAQRLADDGLYATIDVLGEDTTEPAQAEQATQAYLDLLARVPAAGLTGSIDVSLKLSSLGAWCAMSSGCSAMSRLSVPPNATLSS